MRGQANANRHLKQVLYTLGGAVGGGAAGLLFAALGVIAGDGSRTAIGLAAGVAMLALGAWEASGRRASLLQVDRATPQRWMRLGPVRWPLLNGAALGCALTSRIGFPLWYVLPISSFLAGTLWLGPLLWASYGVCRTSLTWVLLRHMRSRRPDAVLDGLIRLQPPIRRAAGGMLSIDAIVFLAAGLL
jgi:hypothetical protein